jgi:DNA-binding IclR family transcriptional regulator
MSRTTVFLQLGRENLTKAAYRVLMVVLASLDDELKTRMPQREIAELLDMKKQSVSRAFQLLVDRQILLIDQSSCRPKVYRLNLDYGSEKHTLRYATRQENKGSDV